MFCCTALYFGNPVLAYSFQFAVMYFGHIVVLITCITANRTSSLLQVTRAWIPSELSESDEFSALPPEFASVPGLWHPVFVLLSYSTSPYLESCLVLTVFLRSSFLSSAFSSAAKGKYDALFTMPFTTYRPAAGNGASLLNRRFTLGIRYASTRLSLIHIQLINPESLLVLRI